MATIGEVYFAMYGDDFDPANVSIWHQTPRKCCANVPSAAIVPVAELSMILVGGRSFELGAVPEYKLAVTAQTLMDAGYVLIQEAVASGSCDSS